MRSVPIPAFLVSTLNSPGCGILEHGSMKNRVYEWEDMINKNMERGHTNVRVRSIEILKRDMGIWKMGIWHV